MSTLRGIHRTFQYITCYSLSDLLEYLLLIWRRFNTSHVTLYPVVVCQRCSFLGFQYITCYSLSFHPDLQVHGLLVSIHHMLLFIETVEIRDGDVYMFQYITCYSLSSSARLSCHMSHCFNTSHVTLYRVGFVRYEIYLLVSIHHMLLFIKFPRLRIYGANFVSIHHMLLFISFLACASTALILFQYITCYSLSVSSPAHLRR